jgi:hypothetical protein
VAHKLAYNRNEYYLYKIDKYCGIEIGRIFDSEMRFNKWFIGAIAQQLMSETDAK